MTSAPSAASDAIRFPVAGMVCGSCVARITRAVKPLDGVSAVRVDLGHEIVTVRRDPARVSDADLTAAIAAAGYQADLSAATGVAIEATHGLLDRLLRRKR